MSVIIDKPGEFSDNRAIFSYLYQAMEQIENALNHITVDQVVGVIDTGSQNSGSQNVGQDIRNELQAQVSTLKSLIVKTADRIESEVEQEITDMSSRYVASSTFGDFLNNVDSRFVQTAEGMSQSISSLEQVLSGKAEQADFEEYRRQLDGYIHIGLISLPDGRREIGIAIGTDIREERTVVDGVETVVITSIPQAAAFTSERLSFFLNNAEVAYISNGRLYITDANVTRGLRLGDVVMSANGGVMDFRYIKEVSADDDRRIRIAGDGGPSGDPE
ncbi:MAG: hypothetical protein MJZ81_07920 [Bacteroidales bacterium]|nr:hypothetical protein [Bacteroidales bacterium]